MTVQELIDSLEKINNKAAKVSIALETDRTEHSICWRGEDLVAVMRLSNPLKDKPEIIDSVVLIPSWEVNIHESSN